MAYYPCNLNSDLGGKLLWTNSSPTSSFPVQTVSIDLTNYDGVLVVFRRSMSDSTVACRACVLKTDSGMGGGFVSASSRAEARDFNVSDSGVSFNYGYISSSTDNDCMIPIHIYGVNFNFL